MFAFFWKRIKDFFITKPGLVKFSVVVFVLAVAVGIFGFVSPVSALEGIGGWVADGVSTLLLMIASFIGKLLVLVIGILLEIVSYNDFTNSKAVEQGWMVLRDLSNLFFILILLVIAFGSILRLENYKYNKLLGKLVIMIILVNFSKMIAGFFIDISQVVLMTFANAFAAAAATNFTEAFKLREMLGITGEYSPSDNITATELISLSLLPVILLTVALFTMVAMVAVFLVRIIMLWVLVILSPLAYLLAVLPTTQRFSKQWWDNFIKWVTTGPILAFFIWFGLTLISGGGLDDINNTGDALVTSGDDGLALSVSNVSDSQSLLSFAMAIGMFVVSLITAQSLGGMAGNMAGKALGKLQTMGMSAMKYTSPALGLAKGAGELAKMGGRKIRREYRDSAFGKYTNVGALVAGAKKRGEEVEGLSKDMATAKGKELYDQRPDWMGGGADVIPETQLVQARYERQVAGEVSTLQKEQKASLLQKVWNKGGKQNEMTRRAVLQSLAAEGHVDDALGTQFFQEEAKWTDEHGDSHEGFAKRDSNGNVTDYDTNLARSNFLRASISKGVDRGTGEKNIDSNALRTLYDIQEAGIKIKHFEYSGEAITNPETGKLALAETVKDKEGNLLDRMQIKNEIMTGELVKPTDRLRVGIHPHNYSKQALSEEGENMRLLSFEPVELEPRRAGETDTEFEERELDHDESQQDFEENKAQYQEFLHKSAYAKTVDKSFREFSSARIGDLLGKFDPKDKTFKIHDDKQFMTQIQKLYQEHPEFVDQVEMKYAAEGYSYTDENGKSQKVANLHELAKNKGWARNSDYHKDETAAIDKKKRDDVNRKSEIDHERNAADFKEKEVNKLRQDAGQISPEAGINYTGYVTSKANAKTKNNEANDIRQELKDMPKEPVTVGFARDEDEVKKYNEQKQRLEDQLAEKEKDAASAKAKADDFKKKFDEATSKQKSTDSSKEREADKLDKEVEHHRSKADHLQTRSRVEDFRGDTDNQEVIQDMSKEVKTSDIKKITDAIESGMANVNASAQGLEPDDFKTVFTNVSGEIANVLGQLKNTPDSVKNNITSELGIMESDISLGKNQSREEQKLTLRVLRDIRGILSRRSQGKGVSTEEKSSFKVKDDDYND